MAHHTVLNKLREEHKSNTRQFLSEKHYDMFHMLYVANTAGKKRVENVLDDIVSFCSLFTPIGFVPRPVSAAEYYTLAYSLYDRVMDAYVRGLIDYDAKKSAVNAILAHVKWFEKKKGKE